MIRMDLFREIPRFAFELPANTLARAARPPSSDAKPKWMALLDQLWVHRPFPLTIDRFSDSGEVIGTFQFSPATLQFGHDGAPTETQWHDTSGAKTLMTGILEQILRPLEAAVAPPEAVTYAGTAGFPPLDWSPTDKMAMGEQARIVNRERMTALRKNATLLAARVNPVETEFHDDPLANLASRRLCGMLSRISCPTTARVEVDFQAQNSWCRITARMDGEFDLLWGSSFIGIEDNGIVIRKRPETQERMLRQRGARMHLLAMADAFERAFGVFGGPVEFELSVTGADMRA